MKAARFHARQDVRVDVVTEPGLRPGAVRIRVAWCGMCGTGLHEFLEGPIFIPPPGEPHPLSGEEAPVTLCHEFSGTVQDVSDDAVGDSVVVEPYFVRDECEPCREGNHRLCTRMGFIGLAGGGGGLSDARKEKAASSGVADHVLDPRSDDVTARVLGLTDGTGADVAFECAGVDPVLDRMLDVVKPAGTVVNVSIWRRPATVDMQKLVLTEVDLRGTIGYVRDHPAVVTLVRTGQVDLAPFVPQHIRLDELVDVGFDTLINHNDTAVKILVEPVVQVGRLQDDGSVPEKQIQRWKDDGGALPPER